MTVPKKTVGKIASDLAQKTPATRDPIELQREMQRDYMQHLFDAATRGKKDFPKQDFFIVVETKRERLLENVIRNFFYNRLSCPTPNYDQTVFLFKHESEDIIYIWTIPDRESAHMLLENKEQVPQEHAQLLQFVIDFDNGKLFQLAKKLNNEPEDIPGAIITIEKGVA